MDLHVDNAVGSPHPNVKLRGATPRITRVHGRDTIGDQLNLEELAGRMRWPSRVNVHRVSATKGRRFQVELGR